MKILDSEFYGDNVRWFIGIITNNVDPKLLGRVQVRILGIHSPKPSDVPFENLPWAYASVPTTEGGTSGIGKIPQMLPGARVLGIFMDGETSQLPLVLGTLPKIEIPTLVQERVLLEDKSTDYEYEAYRPIVPKEERRDNFTLDSRRSQGMRWFIDNGYTVQQAAGIMGNLEYESGLNTTVVSAFEGESSQGIAQWNPAGGRLQKLKEFATNDISPPRDWRDYDVQLSFVLYELRTYGYLGNGKLLNTTRFDGGISEFNSTYVFGDKYERPQRQIFIESLSRREALALKAYNQHMEKA